MVDPDEPSYLDLGCLCKDGQIFGSDCISDCICVWLLLILLHYVNMHMKYTAILVSSHFVYSHFVYSHFVYSHFVYSHFVYSHFVYSHFVYSHFVYSHFVYSHFVYSHFVYSHFVYSLWHTSSIIFLENDMN